MTKPNVKFLVVDDLAGNLLALEGLLRRDGLQVLKARSGREALELLLVEEVALAFLDVQMPEMDGFELAELMRGSERTRRVPIIFVTAGGTDKERRFRGYELGAVDFLFKPIDPHMLRSKADVFFDQAWQRHELRAAAEENARLLQERTMAERRAHEGEAFFRAVADNFPQLAWMAHPDGSAFWYNRRWFEYTGTTLEEVSGEGWLKVQHPDHAERVRHHFRESLQSGMPWEDTFPLRSKEGDFRWFLSRAFPIRDEAGRITRWFGTNTDITVIRQTEEALREAQKTIQLYAQDLEKTVAERTARLRETVQELEAFSYSLAHDMRAPLRSMLGYADILVSEHADRLDPQAKNFLGRIAAAARRLDSMIRDVLSYSHILLEDLAMEPVDVRQLIEELIATYPNLRAAKACISVSPDIPVLKANTAALTQVLSNLLGNAVKFVPPETPPVVRVSAERMSGPSQGEASKNGPWVRLLIEDKGIGIDPAVHPRLFEMFQRFNRAGLYEGTGMGLAIARKAMERMGGRIGVDSAPGQGSRFWIALPAAENGSNGQK